MRALRLGKSTATAAVLFGGLSIAMAQGPAVQAEVRQGEAGSGQIGVQATAALTPQQQIEQSNRISRRATELASRLTRMLSEARREKDILRANCVNRKLTEVNANGRNVEQRARALKDASDANDDGRRSHEYTVLTVLAAKLDSLNQEASQCLGQSVYEAGASQVVTTVPSNAPTIDPTVVGSPPPPPPAVSVPPPISPAS